MQTTTKTASIVLKIIEIVVLLAATGAVGYFMKHFVDIDEDNKADYYDRGLFGRFEFFLYTTSVGVIIAFVSLVGLINEFMEKNGPSIPALCLVWTLQLLVSAALLTKVLLELKDREHIETIYGTIERKPSLCEELDAGKLDYSCKHLTSGLIFGFIGAIVFLFDTSVGFIAFWRKASS